MIWFLNEILSLIAGVLFACLFIFISILLVKFIENHPVTFRELAMSAMMLIDLFIGGLLGFYINTALQGK